MKLSPPQAEQIPIGPPILTTLEKLVGREKYETARKIYQEIYDVEGVFIAEPYPKIEETLLSLKSQKNSRLFVVTSKAEKFALKMVENLKWTKFFDGVFGSGLNGEFRDKKDLLNRVLRETSIEKNNSVMIGDRYHDLDAARELDIEAIGVLWGYGSLEELEKCRPRHLIRTPSELTQTLLHY